MAQRVQCSIRSEHRRQLLGHRGELGHDKVAAQPVGPVDDQGVAGHEGSTVIVALNGMRLLTNRSWRAAASAPR